jgi:hypothetical protein
MILNTTGLHVFQDTSLFVQEGKATGPKVADVTGWLLHCEIITTAHACSQPAADTGGIAGENGKRLYIVWYEERSDIVRYIQNNRGDQ